MAAIAQIGASIAGNAASDAAFKGQMEAVAAQGRQDMLDAAKTEVANKRTETISKLMISGPTAAAQMIK